MTSSTESGRDGPSHILAGRAGRPHGLDGGLYVTRPVSRLLIAGAIVNIGERTLRIERRSGTQQRPILHLEGVSDRNAATALRGLEIGVSVEQAPSLEEGEWWAHQLEGCLVTDGRSEVGRVSRLVELPSCEALEVARDEGTPLLVPMVKDAIRSVDVKAGQIDVDLAFLGEAQ